LSNRCNHAVSVTFLADLNPRNLAEAPANPISSLSPQKLACPPSTLVVVTPV